MNDAQIRNAFHRTFLRRYHGEPTTRVIDEFGLRHGRSRADIAVINGHLTGYEIKSDQDSLDRLSGQVESYSAVFDRASIIVATRHLDGALASVPPCWGVITVSEGPRGGIRFARVRPSKPNPSVDDYAVAQLLWSDEARELLIGLGIKGARLRVPRSSLYHLAVNILDSPRLRRAVRTYLKRREGRQRREPPSPSGD